MTSFKFTTIQNIRIIACSLNNRINTLAKIFRVSFGNSVDFIRQITGLTSFHLLVSERWSRFF